jgi:hypothetical protein
VVDALEEAHKQDRVIDYVDGAKPGALRSMLSGGFFIETPTLVLVSNPHKVDLGVVVAHNNAGDNTYILLLHHEGSLKAVKKFGKGVKELEALIKRLPNKQHFSFQLPNPFKADGIAADFCVEEARKRGKKLPLKVAKALVSVIGTDLGILHYEVLKAATYATATGSDEIEVRHVRGSKAALSEAEVTPVVRALEDLNLPRVLKALNRLQKTAEDPRSTLVKTCRFVSSSVLKWIAAANLESLGYEPKEAADALKINPWYYQNKVLPPAVRWGVPRLGRLLRALADSERAVKLGHVDPWTAFQVRLVKTFGGS